jgi:tRNA wybutosine-synthesizing protein 3
VGELLSYLQILIPQPDKILITSSIQLPDQIFRVIESELKHGMSLRFDARKQKILEALDAPADVYQDLSPKGSIDAPIRSLIDDINRIDGLVTTSSCSGRISVFLEGRKEEANHTESLEESPAGPGGKGGGGAWLFISHDSISITRDAENSSFMSEFKLCEGDSVGEAPLVSSRYIHLKFEPMVRRFCVAVASY